MGEILLIILPVFIVLAFGYSAVWAGLFSDEHVDGLMKFTQTFAIPALLFRAISTLDMGQNFDVPLLFSFFAGVLVAFVVGLFGARLLFGRPWEDAVAISFCCLFSNTLLLGLPITERAYGPDALLGNYAIIAFHAPFGYMLGITAMELVRAKGTPWRNLPVSVGKAMFSNALVLGIALGFVVNLGNITLPTVLIDAVDLVIGAALPAALFGLGGVLYRYRPEGDGTRHQRLCLRQYVWGGQASRRIVCSDRNRAFGGHHNTMDFSPAVMSNLAAPNPTSLATLGFAGTRGRRHHIIEMLVLSGPCGSLSFSDQKKREIAHNKGRPVRPKPQ